MATASEHRTADSQRSLEQDGVLLTVDGVEVYAFTPPVETVADEAERMIISTMKIYHLADALVKKVPGQVVEIDGDRWLVLSHMVSTSPFVCLTAQMVSG